MDLFGIFREDFTPTLGVRNIPKTFPSGIKGKAVGLSAKKKALGDVSNVVSQKLFNAKSADVGGKPSESSCKLTQQDSTPACKPVEKVVEEVQDADEDISDTCSVCELCMEDFEYDIRPADEKWTDESIKHLTEFWTPGTLSPPSKEDWNLYLPSIDLHSSSSISMSPQLEYLPISKVSFFD